jgi:hypothetical protein
MTGNFLMGSPEDNFSNGMYPMAFVKEITKEDIIRSVTDDLIIIDLDLKKFFDAKINGWTDIKEFKNFKDQWS